MCALWQVALETVGRRKVAFAVSDLPGAERAGVLVLAGPGVPREALAAWARALADRSLRAYCILLVDEPSESEAFEAWQEVLEAVLVRIAEDVQALPLALVGLGLAARFAASQQARACLARFHLHVAAPAGTGPAPPAGPSLGPEASASIGRWLAGPFADWLIAELEDPA